MNKSKKIPNKLNSLLKKSSKYFQKINFNKSTSLASSLVDFFENIVIPSTKEINNENLINSLNKNVYYYKSLSKSINNYLNDKTDANFASLLKSSENTFKFLNSINVQIDFSNKKTNDLNIILKSNEKTINSFKAKINKNISRANKGLDLFDKFTELLKSKFPKKPFKNNKKNKFKRKVILFASTPNVEYCNKLNLDYKTEFSKYKEAQDKVDVLDDKIRSIYIDMDDATRELVNTENVVINDYVSLLSHLEQIESLNNIINKTNDKIIKLTKDLETYTIGKNDKEIAETELNIKTLSKQVEDVCNELLTLYGQNEEYSQDFLKGLEETTRLIVDALTEARQKYLDEIDKKEGERFLAFLSLQNSYLKLLAINLQILASC